MNSSSKLDICLPYHDHIPPIAIPPVVYEQENYQVPLWQVITSFAASIFTGFTLLNSIDIYRNRAIQLARGIEQHQGANAIHNLEEQMPSTWPVLFVGTIAWSYLSAHLISHYYAGRNVVLFLNKTSS